MGQKTVLVAQFKTLKAENDLQHIKIVRAMYDIQVLQVCVKNVFYRPAFENCCVEILKVVTFPCDGLSACKGQSYDQIHPSPLPISPTPPSYLFTCRGMVFLFGERGCSNW